MNPKINYLVHKSPSVYPIMSQSNPVYILTYSFLKTILTINLHLRLGFLSSLFHTRLPTKIV
jgi:hypothetical protein